MSCCQYIYWMSSTISIKKTPIKTNVNKKHLTVAEKSPYPFFLIMLHCMCTPHVAVYCKVMFGKIVTTCMRTNNGFLIIPVSSTCFGKLFCPKHAELTGIINKPLLLHLVGCLYYLYQRCTAKQISDKEIYLLSKYIKSILWRVAKCLSYIDDARCLKVKQWVWLLQ